MSSNLRLEWDNDQPERVDPEIKAKWLEALRSGEYPQTTGALQRVADYGDSPKGYCCLGVLADTLVDDEEKIVWRFAKPRYGEPNWAVLSAWSDEREDYTEEDSLLPDVLAERLHLTVDGQLGDFKVWNHSRLAEDCSMRLSSLNDNGFTFSQIADMIEYFL
jgi:hypothetical protein